MTLIAAYKVHNTPILLGDVLITGGASETHCKKINKISANFVIGWTGRRINALAVLKDLYKVFGGKRVSMSEVERFLVEYDTSSFQLIMSGWVINEGEHCFVWNSGYNEMGVKELVYDEEGNGFFNGSGGNFFQSLLNEKLAHGESPGMNNYTKAKMRALSEMCSLTNGEYLAVDRTWRDRFGFSYEALIYNGKEFKYIDDILFFTLDMLIDENRKLRDLKVVSMFYRYKNFGKYSLFQISRAKEGPTDLYCVGTGLESPQQIEHLITLRGGAKPLRLQSRYYCLTARVYNPELIGAGNIMLEQDKGLIRVSDRDGNPYISFDNSFLQGYINDLLRLNDASQ